MISRIVQNSFVNGIISPELHGRHDLKAYFNGAADLLNYVVRRTGGIRKRPGTQHLLDISGTGTVLDNETRVFPYIYDRTNCGLVAIRLKSVTVGEVTSTVGEADLHTWANGTYTEGTPVTSGIEAWIDTVAELQALRCKQIGDTLFFTAMGVTSFKCVVTWSTKTMAFSAVEVNAVVPQLNNLTVTASGFSDVGAGVVEAEKMYAVFAVKDGVMSKAMQRTVRYTLPWAAGARIRVEWVPQWEKHDSYIVAKQFGGSWGYLSRIYQGDQAPVHSDVQTGGLSNEVVTSAAFEIYDEGTASWIEKTTKSSHAALDIGWSVPPDTMSSTPDGISNYHYAGIIAGHPETGNIDGIISFIWNRSKFMRTLRIWFGAILQDNSDSNKVWNVQVNRGNLAGYRLRVYYYNYSTKQWVLYHTQELPTPGPDSGSTGTYYEFTITSPVDGSLYQYSYAIKLLPPSTAQDPDPATPIKWTLRGILPVDIEDRQVFDDNNITPSEITGVQEKLTVGDSGMDCAIADVWEQRLLMASSAEKPFSMWFSNVGDLYNFTSGRPQADSDAFSVTIPATRASKILHVISGKWLLFFTESGVYHCTSVNEGLSHRSIKLNKLTSIAAHPDIEPIESEDRIVFVAQDARTVYEMSYDIAQDSVIPTDRSVLAMHLTEEARIVKSAYQRFPDSVIWFLLDDGTMLGMTYMPEHEVWAWHRHTFAEAAATPRIARDIFSTGTVLDSEGFAPTSDVFVVFETRDGEGDVATLTVERMLAHPLEDSPSVANATLQDHKSATPANIEARLITLRPETPEANTQGLRKSVVDMTMRVRRSADMTILPYESGLAAIKFCQATTSDGKVNLQTGNVKVMPKGYFNQDGQLQIVSDSPYPCEILSIIYKMEVEQ